MGSRILVVDDEESIRYTFRVFLTKEGYQVITAEDYDAALEQISGSDFDLVFADIILGSRSGTDLLRFVRDGGYSCPVVMITGKPNVETAADAVRLGAFDYVPKPVRKETLLHIASMAIKHKALLDEKALADTRSERYRQHLAAVFRSVQDAIITVDDEMRVQEANDAAASICGLDPKGSVGKNFERITSCCNAACLAMLQETLREQTTIRDHRIECRYGDSPARVIEVTSSPLFGQEGAFMGAVLVMKDVTRVNQLERELKDRRQFHRLIGKSGKMQDIYRLLEDLADVDTTILVTGESGTGKELVAETLHYCGNRANRPLIRVNCSALAENLLESELFGHVRGAFTDAVKDKAGRFELAHGGTIFLDEIGDISPKIQLKLLRVIQEKTFERVGDTKTFKADIRIITTTNKDLKAKAETGEFRSDLYYRLKVMEIHLPPLRERMEDIPLLVEHFCEIFNRSQRKRIEGVSREALDILMRFPWPGNIRQLEHAIEHAFILCHGRTILANHLPAEIIEHIDILKSSSRKMYKSPDEILFALRDTGGNKTQAARLTGVSRQTIYRKIREMKKRDQDPDAQR